MSKRQLTKVIKDGIKTGLTIEQAANAAAYEFEMYESEIRMIALDLETKAIIKAAGL